MADLIYNVLFICTGNSARSIIAEGLMNELGHGRFRGFSAGSHPKGEVHPLALETLLSWSIPVDGLRSKSWDEFSAPGGPGMDFVFTVCDQAAGEVCPFWPGQPVTAHWGMPDPADVDGPLDARRKAFIDTAVTMKRRIELIRSLPLEHLDAMSVQREIQRIGTH